MVGKCGQEESKKREAKDKKLGEDKVQAKRSVLPPSYLQDNYSKLHNLQQGNMSVE